MEVTISSAISAAASGIDAGMSWLDAAAGNIANAQTPGYSSLSPVLASLPSAGVTVAAYTAAPPSSSGADLTVQLPDAVLAAMMVKVNAATMRNVYRTYQSIMDDNSSR